MFNKITKFAIYGLVLLTPLFFLPVSFEAFEFNKGYLLFALVSIGILSWLAQMVFKTKKLQFRRTRLDFFVLGFLVVMILSVVFSKDANSSLYGFYGRFWPSLIGILSLGGLYFLLTNVVSPRTVLVEGDKGSKRKTEKATKVLTVQGLLKVFSWSSLAVIAATYFSIFGVWRLAGGVLPGVMQGRNFNPTSGSLEGLSMFLAFIVVFSLVKIAVGQKEVKGEQEAKRPLLINYLLLVGSLGILFIINFWPAWLVIGLSMFGFLAIAFWQRLFKENVNRLALPILFMLISLILIFANPVSGLLSQNNVTGNLPAEILLRQGASWRLAVSSLRANPVLGSGLGNFGYSFARYKPQSFLENNPLWYLRIDRAGNFVAESLATTGILGVLAFLGVLFGFGWLIRRKSKIDKQVSIASLPIIIGFLALIIAQFLYYQNTILAFSFWLMLGLGAVSMRAVSAEALPSQALKRAGQARVFNFKQYPEAGLVLSIVFWVMIVGMAFLYFNMAQYYLADMNYRQYLVNPTSNLANLERAARLGRNRATYHIVLARAYAMEFSDELAKPEPDLARVENLVALAIAEAGQAVQIAPNRVAAQEASAMIYRDIQGLAQGAGEWAVKGFEKALELEPKNPIFLTELGKLSIIQGSEEEGIAFFEQAVNLKADYLAANLQLALISERDGDLDGSIARLENLVISNPFSVEARFQLGRVYYNNDMLTDAEQQFLLALQLFPNHSNSLYALSLLYERRGERTNALAVLKKVLELNPGNEDVKKKIEELE